MNQDTKKTQINIYVCICTRDSPLFFTEHEDTYIVEHYSQVSAISPSYVI